MWLAPLSRYPMLRALARQVLAQVQVERVVVVAQPLAHQHGRSRSLVVTPEWCLVVAQPLAH